MRAEKKKQLAQCMCPAFSRKHVMVRGKCFILSITYSFHMFIMKVHVAGSDVTNPLPIYDNGSPYKPPHQLFPHIDLYSLMQTFVRVSRTQVCANLTPVLVSLFKTNIQEIK